MNRIAIGKKVLRTLTKNRYQGYLVGGCVRDLLLQREIDDVDIATDALPEQVIRLFSKVIPTGIKHGTVTVIMEGIPFEITTFRVEGNYEDFRRPKDVQFVSDLYQDLSRRDFTINAIAMDQYDQVIDPFHGKEALLNKQIISVGNPKDRFLEDPLRMMRAIRFASQLHFTIEQNTWKAIQSHASYLQYIAVERIKMEMDKIMESEDPQVGFQLLFQSGLNNWIKGMKGITFSKEHVEKIIQSIRKTKDPLFRWAIVLFPFQAEERVIFLKHMRFSKKDIHAINKLFLAFAVFQDGLNNKEIKRCLIQSDDRICLRAIELLFLLGYIHRLEEQQWKQIVLEMDQKLKVRKVKDLAVSGKDLINTFQEPPGPWIKALLHNLLDQVIYREIPNEKNILIKQAKKIKEGKLDERKN